ncbi:hypothetical protein JK2ML_1976 [Mycobacterium leprae Kyoto-2]|uniref:Uncharacterized protein n=3 Tax=Mycobacterium leprae TaxID=1769 RepID=Q9CBH4_MYCLE|nr:hypothetical protein DIJ64_10830 [Mycobacterium leprae]OAR20824.1 hypothetical protein A8144_02160 [Mycobacterium leprae 3125609]OAX72028.1 hypothetical protein A3216_02245 [Mycobacterium leprae 7935681]CAR72073.1 very hypothetical protein [Mycobacterium leprae Br4923]BBC17497.1 hypothetical protein JK2ML_1976 [Mycobacterium leprae Kyoto-2]
MIMPKSIIPQERCRHHLNLFRRQNCYFNRFDHKNSIARHERLRIALAPLATTKPAIRPEISDASIASRLIYRVYRGAGLLRSIARKTVLALRLGMPMLGRGEETLSANIPTSKSR